MTQQLFTITAPSGAGKTTLAQALQAYGYWVEAISCTSRNIRDGEQEGTTYYYKSKDEFETMIENGEFAEWVEYDGNYYGITHKEIKRVLQTNKHVFIIVEHGGFLQIKEQYPNSVNIFLHMSKEDCMANMLMRGDSMKSATKRIEKYEDEMKNRGEFDYVVKNVRGQQLATERILKSIVSQYSKSKPPLRDGFWNI
jgi:guanylate kinase